MEKLLILKDGDIFPEKDKDLKLEFDFRLAVKVVLLDGEGNIALVGTRYRLLPGGGVEEGESLREAAVREVREEVGCHMHLVKEIAVTAEFREKIQRHQETHFFLAGVVGEKGKPSSLQEDEQGMVVEWYTLPNAIALLQKEAKEIPFESYHSCFNVRTHLAVLEANQNLINYASEKKYSVVYDEP